MTMTATQIEQLDRDGYAILPDFLSPALLAGTGAIAGYPPTYP